MDRSHSLLSRPVVLGLWFVALALLLIAPGRVPLSRTQEARVLETARQMLASDARHPYLIPTLNGQPRLQKPPLAYWLSAASFKVLGVSAAAGRLPGILAGWGTLGVTYLAGTWLFGRRAGLIAATCLLSSYLFYRYTRLAETDTLATFFVTASCLYFWKAARTGRRIDFHLAAALAAGAALAKGPPVAFPFLFFVALAGLERDAGSLKRLLTSGCLLTLVVLAGAWYAYLASHHLLATVFNEIDDLATGRDHGGSFLNYFPDLLITTAPWSAFVVAAVVFAVQRWRRDARLRGLSCWGLAVFVPLCCVGNKQIHYLFPLLPPAMLLVGAMIDEVLGMRRDAPDARPIRAIFLGTLVGTAGAALAIPATSYHLLHRVSAADYVLAGLVLGVGAAVLFVYLRHGLRAALPAYASGAALLLPLALSLWLPKLVADDFPSFATQLRGRFGEGTYVFYKQFPKLPLNFALRLATPYVQTPKELRKVVRADRQTIALIAVKHAAPPPTVPPGFVRDAALSGRDNDLYAYRVVDPDPSN